MANIYSTKHEKAHEKCYDFLRILCICKALTNVTIHEMCLPIIQVNTVWKNKSWKKQMQQSHFSGLPQFTEIFLKVLLLTINLECQRKIVNMSLYHKDFFNVHTYKCYTCCFEFVIAYFFQKYKSSFVLNKILLEMPKKR